MMMRRDDDRVGAGERARRNASSSPDRTHQSGRAVRWLPILRWAREYRRPWLRLDLVAGVTVAALVVPKNLGYAGIAGVPIENGLYAALAGTLLYPLFCTSRQISTGPSSALAAVAGGAVIVTSVSGEEDATALVAGIALAVGAIFLLLSALRMGWVSQFLSRAVITGFLFGAAIDVAVGELSKLTGTDADGENTWQELASWIGGLGDLHGTTLLVGSISLAALFGLKRLAPQVPGTLVVVVSGLLVAAVLDLSAHGVALVGEVPSGLPTPGIPDIGLVMDNASTVGIAALGIVMIGFAQTAGDARYFAAKHRYRIDVNQETVAQGVANAGAGLLQGIPVSTSLSASSLNDNAGARSPLASLTTGGVVLLTLLIFAPAFSDLPEAVLGAVIIEAVVSGMMDVPELRRLRRVKGVDFWIAVAAIVGVISVGILAGIVIGVLLSVGWLVYVTTTPAMPTLGRAPGTTVFREIDAHPDDERFPGIIVIRLEGGLFFVTADALGDRIRELALTAEPPATAAVLDCRSVVFIDAQGSAKLGELADLARAHDISFRLARVKPAVIEVLARDGVLERVGADHIHIDVNDAVEAELARTR
jgi:sulfate permease, SulP family